MDWTVSRANHLSPRSQIRFRSRAGRNRLRMALLVAAAVVLSACGAGEEASNTTSSDTVSTVGPTSSSSGTAQGNTNSRTIAFVPPGPSDPDTPVGNRWYELLSEGRCQAILDNMELAGVDPAFQPEVALYRAAAQACLGQWEAAEADFDDFGPSRPSNPRICGRAVVYDWVATLLQARRADPDLDPTFVPAAPQPPCPGETTTTEDETTTTTEDETTTTSISTSTSPTA